MSNEVETEAAPEVATGAPEEVKAPSDEAPAALVPPAADARWELMKQWAGTHVETPVAYSGFRNVCDLVLAGMKKIEEGLPVVTVPDLDGENTKARLVREENESSK